MVRAMRAVVFFFVSGCRSLGVEASLRATEGRVTRELIEQQLQNELEALLGHGGSRERLERVQAALAPHFAALPKRGDGGVDRASAHYALQRYFALKHGWTVKGLAAGTEVADEPTSASVVKSKMPAVVFELVERRLSGKSMTLSELVVLAATIEDLVHSGTIDMLTVTYGIAGLSVDEPFRNSSDAELVRSPPVCFGRRSVARSCGNAEKPLSVDEWNAKFTPGAHKASDAKMRSAVESALAASMNSTDFNQPALPWSQEEELLSETLREHLGATANVGLSMLRGFLRVLAFLAVIMASAVAMKGHVATAFFPEGCDELPNLSHTAPRSSGAGKDRFV